MAKGQSFSRERRRTGKALGARVQGPALFRSVAARGKARSRHCSARGKRTGSALALAARPEYLTAGANRDAKKGVSKEGFRNILWLLRGVPYPRTFWATISGESIERIVGGKSGNDRMTALFREAQGLPISRTIVEAVAKQKDFMRRIRSDSGGGARDRLLREEILLLSGNYDAETIQALGLPACEGSEFISLKVKNQRERQIVRSAGFDI